MKHSKFFRKALGAIAITVALLARASMAQEPTPIEDAIAKKDTARVEQLLKADPSLAKKPLDEIGNTALIAAVESPEITRVLIKAGADAKTATGLSVLHAALGMGGNLEVFEALVNGGADLNATTKDGETLLMRLARVKTPEAVTKIADRLLAKTPALLNQQDAIGYTALMYAVDHANSALVKALLAKGASTSIKTQDGQTALGFAQARLTDLKSQGAASTPADTEIIGLLESAASKEKAGQ
jgi:ankyrin repeat protein